MVLVSNAIEIILTLPLVLMSIVIYPLFGLMMLICIIMKFFNKQLSMKIFNKTEYILQTESTAFYYNMISIFMIWLFFLVHILNIINNDTFCMIIGVSSLLSLWYFVYIIDYHLYRYKSRKVK